VQDGSSTSLELDLEHYVVPAPSTNSGFVYAANNAETPRSLGHAGVFANMNGPGSVSYSFKDAGFSVDRPATIKVFLGNPSCKYVNCTLLWHLEK
jgi:6-phosphofructo-2-kinase/fructose-2,6-biphosphatase